MESVGNCPSHSVLQLMSLRFGICWWQHCLQIQHKHKIQEFLYFILQVWSADIIKPVTNNNYVNNVEIVDVANKCWNYALYSCQDLDVSFLVRYKEHYLKYDSFSSL